MARLWSLVCLVAVSCNLEAGEVLSNGIVLPDAWPPHPKELTRAPLAEPPYLKQPPTVIPIDVGRQLFVDDFLIENATLKRTYHLPKYHAASPVLVPNKPWEGMDKQVGAGVYSDGVWYDPKDQLFKMWYWSGIASREPLRTATCYATSKDGIHWEKPSLDVVPGTNIVLPDDRDLHRNSSTVWLDHEEQDPAKRFKIFRTVNPQNARRHFMQYHTSPDGIHWTLAYESVDCGDRSTVFFNGHRRRWIASLRYGQPEVSRCRSYFEAADALSMSKFPSRAVKENLWVAADQLDPAREDLKLRRPADRPFDLVPSQLYNLDCIAYESLLLGLFTVWRGHPADEVKRPKINEVCVGYSRDGFHWTRPDRRAFCGVSEDRKAWNFANVQSAGGCCLVVGDELYFYVGGTSWAGKSRLGWPNNTGLAILRRDGFASMNAKDQEGVLTTRPVGFHGKYLFVNANTKEGELRAEVLDRDGKVIGPFTKENCQPLAGDSTRTPITWKGAADLTAVVGKAVRLRFHLRQGDLYAFWVSATPGGASNGFVAAGGPGFQGYRAE